MTLHAVAFDRAGNFDTFTGVYKPPADTAPAPAAVSAITGTAGQAAVTISWAAPETGVTLYGVQLYVFNSSNVKVASAPLRETSAKTLTINSLNAGHGLLLHREGQERGRLRSGVHAPGPADPDRRDRHRLDRDGEVEER